MVCPMTPPPHTVLKLLRTLRLLPMLFFLRFIVCRTPSTNADVRPALILTFYKQLSFSVFPTFFLHFPNFHIMFFLCVSLKIIVFLIFFVFSRISDHYLRTVSKSCCGRVMLLRI